MCALNRVQFAIRKDGESMILVEVDRHMQRTPTTRISVEAAGAWVLAGRPHETGFWVEVVHDGHRNRRVLRYAEPLE